MQIKEKIKKICIKQLDSAYKKQLAASKLTYQEWVCKKERKEKKPYFRDKEAFVIIYQNNGIVYDSVHIYLSEYFEKYPQAQLLYGDEDLMTAPGKRENPWYKPDWSPDTYLSHFYLGSVIAIRKKVWDEVIKEHIPMLRIMSNVEGVCFSSAQEIRPLLDRILEAIGGFQKGCQSIHRVPHILYHVDSETVWQDYLASSSNNRYPEPEKQGLVSVIIPSKDNVEVLENCLNALKDLQKLEIILVDNGSSEENRKKIEAIPGERKYLYHPMEFNFSKMCNMGAKEAKGEYLLFLNDDIEVCGKEWLQKMKSKAALEYVGAVGLKLYYPQTKKIQHAGITNLPVGPVHKLQFAEDSKDYYFGRNKGEWNCLAVTAAGLLVEASKFWEMGGFKEELQVAYNDVELGFALHEAGYHNVVILDEYAYHHESLSRGEDATRQKRERLLSERAKLYELHPALQGKDPYYPEELTKEGLDSRIVPGYVNAGNTIEKAKLKHFSFSREELREDKCLMINVEQSVSGIVKGYGVVLGDDNACYDKYVVLSKDTQDFSQAYIVKVTRQYRQDLEENMPDQKNVALCGFAIELPTEQDRLSSEYQIGMVAVHKVSKLKLLNWSGWYLRGKE